MKKIIVFAVTLLTLFLLVTACGGQAAAEEDRGMSEEPAAEEPMTVNVSAEMAGEGDGSFTSADSYLSAERLIIRNGDINMEVNDTHQTRDDIRGIVDQLRAKGAFVLSTNEYGGGAEGNPNINMVIRVPAESFDNVMEQIAGMAVVVNTRNENSDDITEEYYDLDNRLDSLEAARERLVEIMENADNTEDLLTAERQLTQRETEIESLKGRQKYLGESARLSRISITLQPYILSQPIDTSWKPLETIRQAVDDLIDGLKGFIDFLLYFIIAVAPWLALFGFIIWRGVKYYDKRQKKKEVKGEKEK